MKKTTISNFAKGAILSAILIMGNSCKLEDDLVNPSSLTTDQAGNEFIFNGLQLNMAGFFITATQFGMDNTRMLAMFGATYENAYTANSFNGIWFSAYSDIMVNANLLLEKTAEDPATPELEYNAFYQGTSKVMKAYVLMTMVDYFGDIPYSQAFNTLDFNAPVDSGEDVYQDALALLDDAIADFDLVDATTVKPTKDQFYNADEALWRKLAKTLKFKFYLQTRLVTDVASEAAMDALLLEGDMISDRSEDFVFRSFGNSQSNPNTYHPWFYGNYLTSANQYMSNSYMKELFDAKSYVDDGTPVTIRDPRVRFYFYRQTTSPTTDVNELTCSSATSPPPHYPAGTAYCQLPNGYWGRDHLNFEGTPPDGLRRTIYGLYPAGGEFDASQGVGVDELEPAHLGAGAKGKGIVPIMLYSYVLFMQAEYELVMKSDPVAANATMMAAIDESIGKVIAFDPSVLPTSGAVLNTFNPTAISNYKAAVQLRYDAGYETDYFPGGTPVAANATADEKLDVLIHEYWVALWGNGVEAYNTVRRTGKPGNLQPALALNPGQFYRSFTYPAVFVIRNSSATQKPDNTVKVFWDTNPAGFVK